MAVAEGPHPTWVLVEVDPGQGAFGHAVIVPSNEAIETDFAFLVERAKQGVFGPDIMLRVTDPTGHILVQVPFSAETGLFEGEDLPLQPDLETVPWPAGAASLDLLIEGVVVDSLTPSTQPVVTIDPVDPSPGRQFTVSWVGEDPDGDTLLYSVLWSIDGGQTWRAIDTGFPDTTAQIDTDLFQLPGGEAHLQVMASDGMSTGSAVVGPLSIPGGAPTGLIAAPETVLQHQIQEITFHVNDPEDGPITSGAWSSDLDGELGEGRIVSTRLLSVGTHQISVTLGDTDGNEVTLTHALEVVASEIPAPRAPGSVPEAETMLALFPDLDGYTTNGAQEESPAAGGTGVPGAIVGAIGAIVVLGGALAWRRARDQKSRPRGH
jgi:hypothetical protein